MTYFVQKKVMTGKSKFGKIKVWIEPLNATAFKWSLRPTTTGCIIHQRRKINGSP